MLTEIEQIEFLKRRKELVAAEIKDLESQIEANAADSLVVAVLHESKMYRQTELITIGMYLETFTIGHDLR